MNSNQEWADDFEKRILKWVVEVMNFIDEVPKTTASISVTRQLADASGSTGANFVEARAGRSRKEFISSVGIAAKECKESLFWLRVLRETNLGDQKSIDALGKEGNEIASVLTTICKNAKSNS